MSHHFKKVELVYCSEFTGVLSWGLIGVHVTWEERGRRAVFCVVSNTCRWINYR